MKERVLLADMSSTLSSVEENNILEHSISLVIVAFCRVFTTLQ